jgi:hypothetical protein
MSDMKNQLLVAKNKIIEVEAREGQTAARVVLLQQRLDESCRMCDKRHQRIIELESALRHLRNADKVAK